MLSNMELIIIFVIMMIISNIMKNFKGSERPVGRKGSPIHPSLPHRPLYFPGMEPQVGPVEADPDGRELVSRPVSPKGEGFEGSKDVLLPIEDKAKTEARKKVAPLKARIPAKKVAIAVKPPLKPPLGESSDGDLELKELLESGKLPLIVVASEILAAPRSQRPYRLRSG